MIKKTQQEKIGQYDEVTTHCIEVVLVMHLILFLILSLMLLLLLYLMLFFISRRKDPNYLVSTIIILNKIKLFFGR